LEMDTYNHDDDNGTDNGQVGPSDYKEWITKRFPSVLGFDAAYEMVPAKHQSIEDLVKWVSDALSYDTGLTLSRNQERIILQGFFIALRQRGFQMWQCPEEDEAKAS
jgi:hypothetical protein